MRTITRRPSHTVTEARIRRASASNGHGPNPGMRAQLLSDAVIAGYIHDISVRHRPETHEGAGRGTGHSHTRR